MNTEAKNPNLSADALSLLSEKQVREIIDSSPGSTRNGLYSEELDSAHRRVLETKNQDLINAFKDSAFHAMTGYNASNGFGVRDSLGHAVQDMLRDGNRFRMDRLTNTGLDYGDQREMKSSLRVLSAELRAHAAENEIKVHSTSPFVTHAAAPAPVARP